MKLVNYAMEYNQLHGFNVLPLINTVPQVEWVQWQNNVMDPAEICAFNWQSINGIGAVSGIYKLRCLNFDNVTNASIIKEFQISLGLPSDYKWTVISGTGREYQIWFCCDEDPIISDFFDGEKPFYSYMLKENKCDSIELRWEQCQTILPPSCDASGKKYKFLFSGSSDMPEKSPSKISTEKLCNALNNYCVTPQDVCMITAMDAGGPVSEKPEENKYGAIEQHFWDIRNDKVKLFSNLLIGFLETEGYGKMIVNKDYIFIRDIDNVISEIPKITIKDHILEFITNNSEGSDRALLLEHFIRNAGVLCGERILECLHTIRPDLISGTKEKEYFFFRNCYIEVTKDEINQKDYCELEGKIWEKQKAQNDFYFTSARSEFETFIENICRQDMERISALRSAIGYLLVSYKDPSSAKAVIFIDEKLSDNAFGRSGKGLVSKAISSMKNVLKIDGKNFSFDRNFMFQAVDQDTQLIIFDDVKKKFSFEKLFSILTEGITIEKKNKNEYRVPYERSPKILITTNNTVEGSDDSSIDRQFVIEFSDYYNAKYKPKDEFGHLFFDEWTKEQWASFYNYMVECCRYYLKNGLKSYEYVNLTKKKLIDSTAPEFEEFICELELNKEYIKKELFERFKKEYEDFGQIKYNTLSKWTKVYADLYNLDIIERKSGIERYMYLRKKGENSLKTKFYADRKIKNHDPL